MKLIIKQPVMPDETFLGKFVIEVEFMHGDADAYTKENYVGDDEEDCLRVLAACGDSPQSPGSGGDDDDAYDAWCFKTFKSEDFNPYDVTYNDIRAAYDSYEVFFYDHSGKKCEVAVK